MKIKTEALTGPALDWAVAKCEELLYLWDTRTDPPHPAYKKNNEHEVWGYYAPSTSWQEGGPIIEREEIGIRRNAPCSDGRQWEASGSITAKGAGYRWGYGPTPLIAAMRCYVASKMGDTIDIPEELV